MLTATAVFKLARDVHVSFLTAALESQLSSDRYLYPHYRYFVREMRIIAYRQLLESYISMTLESMAHAFGVSEEYIDK